MPEQAEQTDQQEEQQQTDQQEAQQVEQPEETQPEVKPEPINEDRILQKLQSWAGRRDAELIQRLAALEERLNETNPYNVPKQEEVDEFNFDNPKESIYRALNAYEQQKQQTEKKFGADVLAATKNLMADNPAFKNRQFGTAVVMEIDKIYPTLDRGLKPEIAAELMVRRAADNVRMRGIEPTPSKTPQNIQEGGVTPPDGTEKKSPVIPLSAAAKEMQRKLGYTDEQAQEVLGSETN